MSGSSAPFDLVALVADKNAEAALQGLFERPKALGIRALTWKTYVHPERDPGCLRHSAEFLRALRGQFVHALVLFDRHGCGREGVSAEDLEAEVERRLRDSGWGECAAAVCLDPELEVWVWADSPEVPAALGWTSGSVDLRAWLESKGLWRPGENKPSDPKAAMEAVLWEKRVPRSSAIYDRLARRVGFRRCTDRAFRKLTGVLREWFPEP